MENNIFKLKNGVNVIIKECDNKDVDQIYDIQNKIIDNFKEEEKGYFLPFKKESYFRLLTNNKEGKIYGAFIGKTMIGWIFPIYIK